MEETRCKLYGMLCDPQYIKMHDISRRVYDPEGIAPTIHTMGGGGVRPHISWLEKSQRTSAGERNNIPHDNGSGSAIQS